MSKPENPSADRRAETIELGGITVLRFHPLSKRIKDNIPRCVSCGQIDEPEWHDAESCPACGGWLPFPTAKLSYKLKADSGYECTSSQPIYHEQWVALNMVLNGGPEYSRSLIDQSKADPA